ncbi:TonB-dependent receptor [soil metagenome]
MKNISKVARLRAGVAPIIIGAALLSSQAFAQTAPQTADETSADAPEDAIIVTGSLIRNPNLVSSSPVNVTTAEEIELRQANTAEELLREIPGIVPGIGSAVNNGNAGQATVDLRGLGSNRNIVLLDGNRVVPGSLSGIFDLNNVPLALVERVDVLTGGASTTYGADAISGVVNFITKRDFAGMEVQASNQITERGDGNTVRLDATLGANFDDGKGNAVLSIGYQQADPVFQGDRNFSRVSLTRLDATVAGGSPTSTPSNFAVPGLGEQQIDASGALVDPYAPFNFNPANLLQLPFERFNIFAAAHYEVSDAIEVYTRGLFSKNRVETNLASSGIFNQPVTLNLNNPFMPAAARATFCANNDFDADTPGIQSLTGAQCAAAATATGRDDPNYQETTTNVRRRTTETGPRSSLYETQVFDYRIGARGGITSTIDWDLSGSYGESTNTQNIGGYVNVSKARQAALSDDGITCQDPSGGCVPLNLFGQPGSISPESAAFLQTSSVTAVKVSLAQVHGQISGDFGAVSPMAEDPISFAVGGEYRKYKATQEADVIAQDPGILGGAGGATIPFKGGYEVYEAFGELIAPLVQGKPFIEDLTVNGGIRYSSYKVFAANSPKYQTTTWKGGGSWSPVDGLKLRGNYAHSVRAPNINELFAPPVTSLTNLGTDPCAGAAPLGNANLAAVCLGQGAPAFTLGNITNPAAGQPNITTGGNLGLKPETANTITLGGVFSSKAIPGFSISLDYYNIKIKNAITTPTPDDIIFACFGADPANPSADAATSAACTGIRRDPSTGGLDGDPAFTPGLLGVQSNLGVLKTSGLDLTINYNRDLGFAHLGLSFNGNHTIESQFKASPISDFRECVGLYSPNCSSQSGSLQPKWQFSQRTTLGFGKVDVSLLWSYIDKMKYEPSVLADEITSALSTPDDCPDPAGADAGGCVTDPAFRKIKAAHYFDLTTRVAATDNLTITLTAMNLFDKKPPVVSNDIGSTTYNSGNTYPSTYDALGRRYAITAKLKF